METVFIVNPKAGKKKNIEKFLDSIKSTALKANINCHTYITKDIGDAKRFVKSYCEKNGPARFIACGGDGTLNEVLNGAIDFEESEIGVIPLGTGNDFCRNFSSSDFNNILSQINGKSIKCDAIKYKTCNESVFQYGANMFNIGFDCNVADMTSTIKKKTFFSGPFAYLISVFVILIKKKGANLLIEIDDREVHNGKLLLTSIANGSFCGGGIKSNPLACVNDGIININIVKNISRLNFLTKLPFYMKGTFLKIKGIEKIISSQNCKKITITPLDKNMLLCTDGEISSAEKTIFEVVHNAFNFVIPAAD